MAFQFDNSGTGGGGVSGFAPDIIGSRSVPEVVGTSGLDVNSVLNTSFQLIAFIVSSGGAVDVTNNPQISQGFADGQRLLIIGTSDTDTVQFDTGDGLLMNGPIIMTENVSIEFLWDGTNWNEIDRSQ